MNSTSTHTPEELAANNSRPLLDVCISLGVLEGFFIILFFVSRSTGTDNKRPEYGMVLLMFTSYLLGLVKILVAIMLVKFGGIGRHLYTLDAPTIIIMLKLTKVLEFICPLSTSFTKLGVCCYYWKIFSFISKNYRIAIQTLSAMMVSLIIVQFVFPFANCRPFAYNWDKTIPGNCYVDSMRLWSNITIPSIITDIFMLCIPVPALIKLRVPKAIKYGAALVFAVFIFGIIASIMRFVSLMQIMNTLDITYETIRPLCWTLTESGVHLIAGIMPTLRPLLVLIGKHLNIASCISTFTWGSLGSKTLVDEIPQKGEVKRISSEKPHLASIQRVKSIRLDSGTEVDVHLV